MEYEIKIAEVDGGVVPAAESIQVTTAKNGTESGDTCKVTPPVDEQLEGRNGDSLTAISGSGITAESVAAPQVGEQGQLQHALVGLPDVAPVDRRFSEIEATPFPLGLDDPYEKWGFEDSATFPDPELAIRIAKNFLGPEFTPACESFIRRETEVLPFSATSTAPAPDGDADNVAEGPVGTAGHAQWRAGDSPASSGSQVFQWGPCMRCGHQWNSRGGVTEKPKWCAKCRSVGWETLARSRQRPTKVKKVLVRRGPRKYAVVDPTSIPIESAQVPASRQESPAVAGSALSSVPRPLGILTPPPGWNK